MWYYWLIILSMADANMVMASADEIRSTGLFSESEIQAAQNDAGGFVGTRTVERVGEVSYYITKRGTAVLPPQQGEY